MGSRLRKLRRSMAVPSLAPDGVAVSGSGRIAYGAGCVWWDAVEKSAANPSGLPCCPHCGSVLFEFSETTWWQDALRQEAEKPGYLPTLIWSQGKCFKTWAETVDAYQRASAGGTVVGG